MAQGAPHCLPITKAGNNVNPSVPLPFLQKATLNCGHCSVHIVAGITFPPAVAAVLLPENDSNLKKLRTPAFGGTAKQRFAGIVLLYSAAPYWQKKGT